jgi:hypothetical protein
MPLPLQLRESEMFDLGSVPYKDGDELCIACVLFAHTLSVQKGSVRYPALFDFAAVLHNEMDVIAASNNLVYVLSVGCSIHQQHTKKKNQIEHRKHEQASSRPPFLVIASTYLP